MRFLIILSFLFIKIDLFSDELLWVNEQIEAIKPEREGLKDSEISLLNDPIIFLNNKSTLKTKSKLRPKSVNKTVVKKSYKSNRAVKTISISKVKYQLFLEAIINNSALINGKWYSLYDKIKGYKLIKIDRTSIVLVKNKKKIMLSTSTKNRTIKFKNR
ncbi:MAG: hypothetical protein U9P72_10880 [Campylobacterota bacterium]|nr:hypothetical protein [Campylobacterota bacterium]